MPAVLVSTHVRRVSLVLLLRRSMCGKAKPYRPSPNINLRLRLLGSRRSLSPKSILHSSEGHSPSAHRAAEPQEKPLVITCVDANGPRSQQVAARLFQAAAVRPSFHALRLSADRDVRAPESRRREFGNWSHSSHFALQAQLFAVKLRPAP
jgi:hypothetical protein